MSGDRSLPRTVSYCSASHSPPPSLLLLNAAGTHVSAEHPGFFGSVSLVFSIVLLPVICFILQPPSSPLDGDCLTVLHAQFKGNYLLLQLFVAYQLMLHYKDLH